MGLPQRGRAAGRVLSSRLGGVRGISCDGVSGSGDAVGGVTSLRKRVVRVAAGSGPVARWPSESGGRIAVTAPGDAPNAPAKAPIGVVVEPVSEVPPPVGGEGPLPRQRVPCEPSVLLALTSSCRTSRLVTGGAAEVLDTQRAAASTRCQDSSRESIRVPRTRRLMAQIRSLVGTVSHRGGPGLDPAYGYWNPPGTVGGRRLVPGRHRPAEVSGLRPWCSGWFAPRRPDWRAGVSCVCSTAGWPGRCRTRE